MTRKTTFLRKQAIVHLLRAVAGVSGQSSFVMIGTGAVIARLKHVPLDLMWTRAIDIYPHGVPDAEDIATLIDGTLGEGSPFDETFGYYAHGVGERTACLPDGWEERAITFEAPGLAEVVWPLPRGQRHRAVEALRLARKGQVFNTGVLSLEAIKARSRTISNPNAPDAAEIDRRISSAEESAARQRSPTAGP